MSRTPYSALEITLRRAWQHSGRRILLLCVLVILLWTGYMSYPSSPYLPADEAAFEVSPPFIEPPFVEDVVPSPLDDPPPAPPILLEDEFEPVVDEPPPRQKPTWITKEPKDWNVTAAVEQRDNFIFTDVIPSLRNAPPPSSHPCQRSDSFGPLLLIAVFSTAKGVQQRDLMRVLQTRGLNERSPRVEFKFIIGRSANRTLQRMVEMERDVRRDIVVLETDENMDYGKTYSFYRWVAARPDGERPQFILKTDEDTFLVLPNVLHSFSSLDCSEPIYWGTLWGSCLDCFPLYMRGMAYALSWPLVRWIASGNLPYHYVNGTEDIRTGAWLLSLPVDVPVKVVDWHIHMGNYDGGTIPWDTHTVALHSMKDPWLWTETAVKLVQKWKDEEREYTYPPTLDDTSSAVTEDWM